MNITIENLPKSQVKLIIKLAEAELSKYKDMAFRKLNEQIKVPGFRQGHIPSEIIEQKIGKEGVKSQLIEIALPQTYADAVTEKKIQVMAKPKIEIISDEPFKYTAVVSVFPEVKIGNYKKIKIPQEKVKITDKEFEDFQKEMQKHYEKYEEVDRETKKGDKVEIDFQGFDEAGVPLDKTESKNHPVVIGEGSMIPGFEDNLIGVKKGEEKEFFITFPKDYRAKNFQNKKVKFKVKLNKVFEVIKPEINEEFLEKVHGKKITMQEFEEKVKQDILKRKEKDEKNRQENQFLEEIAKITDVEIADDVIEEEIDDILHRLKHQLEAYGMNYDQYMEGLKKQGKDIRAEKRSQAEKQLRLRYGLQHIFKEEKIDTEEKEVEAEVEKILQNYPEEKRNSLKGEYQKGKPLFNQLKNQLKLDKLFERCL